MSPATEYFEPEVALVELGDSVVVLAWVPSGIVMAFEWDWDVGCDCKVG